MRRGRPVWFTVICLALSTVFLLAEAVSAKVPQGYRDIKLGMKKKSVVEMLENTRLHYSFDDLGTEIREVVRGDDLFRYATYVFNEDGTLVEIGLQMREILGQDRVLELFNSQHGLKLSPFQAVADGDRTVEVKDNSVVLKIAPPNKTQAARQ